MPKTFYEVEPVHRRERAILVGVHNADLSSLHVEELLEELVLLADTAGADVAETMVQNRHRPDSATFVGPGFADRVRGRVEALDADLVIFDDDLTPAQVRNLEKTISAKILDRSGLILDIFAERAKTREAKTQVELAQLEYLLPRLTRAWTHLSRQVGGIGTRGPGETQLEVDRRLVRTRIAELHKELERIGRQRQTQRRGRGNFFQATLVGYTNAGKSTLLNQLADADVFVEDRLFATLDATTRVVELRGEGKILLTDTVGFIRKLPPGLVASFRSTLEETVVADLLVHVVDVSDPFYEDHITSANQVLEDLGILEHPTLMVFNKIDRSDEKGVHRALAGHPGAVAISARSGEGLDGLLDALLKETIRGQVTVEVSIPQDRPDLANVAHELGKITDRSYDAERVHLTLQTSPADAGRIQSMLEGLTGARFRMLETGTGTGAPEDGSRE
jgi:GTP-binding protein HflX